MTGRGGIFAEPTRGFSIYFMKQFINIELVRYGNGDYAEGNVICHYMIKRIEIPKQLIEQGITVEEVKQLIQEVFMAAGSFGHEPEKTLKTIITLETEPIVV